MSGSSSERTWVQRTRLECDRFVESIKPQNVLFLAAFHHPSRMPGSFFKRPQHGSFNICFFIQYPRYGACSSPADVSDRWVVRIPIEPRLSFEASRKIESEVAVMKLLAARTTIPVPKLIAYGINERFSPFRNFMIMEYVSGEKFTARKYEALSPTQLCRFYESLADIFIQLRRIELPAIGRPVMGRHGSISVLNPVMTIDMNMQGLKGMDPFHTMSRYNNGGPLHTARDYIEMLNDLLYNAFHLGYRTAGTNKEEKCILYNLHAVREFSEEWLKPSDSTEPFVLVHGDFEPFNLIVNHEGTITGVLDWEWSRSVPRRFFQPPMWLRSIDVSPGTACDGYANFRQTMFRFIGILRTREMVMYRNMMLADEWSRAVNGPDFLLAGVLEASSFQSWLLTMYIWPYLETSLDYKDQVDKYMRENPSKHAVVIRKVLHGNIYRMIQARKRESRLEKERQEALRRESRLEEEEISSG